MVGIFCQADKIWLKIIILGVDACNTVLEVLLFAAAVNLGQSWNTVLTLFGGEPKPQKMLA